MCQVQKTYILKDEPFFDKITLIKLVLQIGEVGKISHPALNRVKNSKDDLAVRKHDDFHGFFKKTTLALLEADLHKSQTACNLPFSA
jgi:hypothetical protein